jgi:hypothetical protein
MLCCTTIKIDNLIQNFDRNKLAKWISYIIVDSLFNQINENHSCATKRFAIKNNCHFIFKDVE